MDEINDGGTAFPVNTENAGHEGACYPSYGMTLRDYFAAKAFPAAAVGAHRSGEDFLRIEHYEDAAMNAYRLADAMLKARQS